ncbi:MAG: hypothetical protein HON90_17600, partial [Halobacteriovoraceae bacterium]|nr:hypothetical protein [Halobacteriovoraceae bacterium]
MYKKNIFIFIVITILCSFKANSSPSIGPNFGSLSTWKNSTEWKEVYKLIDEQKLQKALNKVQAKLNSFQSKQDVKNWTVALIVKQNLLNGLHSVEKSVNEFKKEKWPKNLSSQVLLNLYYAQTLRNYYNYYSWEINKREKVQSKQKLNLKQWTKEDIFTEIQRAFVTVWKRRDELLSTKTDVFKAFIKEGSYPRSVRGTVRDSLTYFYANFMANATFWSAKHSNEKSLLDPNEMLKIKKDFANEKYLMDSSISPIKKIMAILTDLEKWHWRNDRLSSLMEAYFEKIRTLKNNFTN